MLENKYIIKLCLYHKLDEKDGNHMSLITNSYMENNNYKCQHMNNQQGWDYIDTFYALSPMFRPIPIGMKLICIKISEINSLNFIKNIYISDGLFNYSDDCLYFITYNLIVINTIPLYFYSRENKIFASFIKKPPSNIWKPAKIPYIYVLPQGIVNINNPDKTLFHCVNGRCLPFNEKHILHYNSYDEMKSYTIDKCVMLCNQIIVNNEKINEDIINIVKKLDKYNKNIFNNFISNIHPYIISLLLLIFIILLFLIIKIH
jgi:hypothetical protein